MWFILSLSITFQIIAVIVALRMIRITGKSVAWILVSAALTLMAARRIISLYNLVSGLSAPHDTIYSELVGLIISGILVLGLANVAPLFRSIQRARALLAGTEKEYRLMFQQNPQPMLIYDLENLNIINVNEAALQHYGYSRKEFLSMTIRNIRPPDEVPALLKHLSTDLPRFEKAGIWRHRKKDGSIIHVEITSYKILFGGLPARLVLINDVTQRLLAEKTLKSSEERYRLFFEEDLSGDLIASADGTIMQCNPTFARIFGFPSTESVYTKKLPDIFPGSDSFQDFLKILRQNHKLENYEAEFKKLDGSAVYIIANFIGKYDDTGELQEIKGYIFDITSHKKTEDQLYQSQKMEAVGRLAGGIAHDFNNSLTVILSYSDLLLKSLKAAPEEIRMLQQIKKGGERAAALTRQLLAFSRRQILQPKVLNLNAIIDELSGMLKRLIGEHIHLEIDLEPGLGKVQADPGQIEQIIMNLVVNAGDAMPEGGHLIIKTGNRILRDPNWIPQTTVRTGPYVMISVSDNGVGMDKETESQIFEPFFTTKETGKGTGLGLSTVYGIVKQSGGYIRVSTEPGNGATFTVYLPRIDAVDTDLPEEAPADNFHPGAERILVVEDDTMVRDLAVSVLRDSGYSVIEVPSARDALNYVRDHNDPVQLLLTDIIMPDIDGHELAKQILEISPDVRVLYMSGYTDNVMIREGKLNPEVNFLHKPFSPADLTRKIRSILDLPKS